MVILQWFDTWLSNALPAWVCMPIGLLMFTIDSGVRYVQDDSEGDDFEPADGDLDEEEEDEEEAGESEEGL